MDVTTILVAAMTALCSLLGTYFANRKSSALIQYRLEQLEKKQDIHNQVIERVYKLEQKIGIINSEMQHIEQDIK